LLADVVIDYFVAGSGNAIER